MPARGAIHHRVADDNVLVPHEINICARLDHDLPAVHTFADVIETFADEIQVEAVDAKRAETLARRALKIERHQPLGKPLSPKL